MNRWYACTPLQISRFHSQLPGWAEGGRHWGQKALGGDRGVAGTRKKGGGGTEMTPIRSSFGSEVRHIYPHIHGSDSHPPLTYTHAHTYVYYPH